MVWRFETALTRRSLISCVYLIILFTICNVFGIRLPTLKHDNLLIHGTRHHYTKKCFLLPTCVTRMERLCRERISELPSCLLAYGSVTACARM